MTEREEELKSLLMKMKEESEKAGLKLNIGKTKFMASGPITSWQTGEKNQNNDRFYLLSLQNHGDCSHEVKRHLLLGIKAMRNLDSLLKSRDIILLTRVHIVKAMFFSSNHVLM